VITLASGDSFEPFTILNANGSISGFDVDIMALVTKKIGLKVNFALGNWSDMQSKAMNRQLDGLSSAVITELRKPFYNFSIPYFKYYAIAIVKKGNPQKIKKTSDLKGKRIAVQKGNKAFEKIAKDLGQNLKFIYFDSMHDLIKAVVSGQVDFTILDETLGYVARNVGLIHSIEEAFIVDHEPIELHFALRNDYPQLISLINKSLQSITVQESYELREKWFGDNGGPKSSTDKKFALTKNEVSYLKLKHILKVCTNPNAMPYEAIDNKGLHDGMAKDYLAILSHNIGIKTQLYPTHTWAETFIAIK
jgi:polar amino acid transport system substrate-binding protein